MDVVSHLEDLVRRYIRLRDFYQANALIKGHVTLSLEPAPTFVGSKAVTSRGLLQLNQEKHSFTQRDFALKGG